MNEYELIGRLADLDSRLKKLECVEPIQEQSTPIPSLIEAVDMVDACDQIISDTDLALRSMSVVDICTILHGIDARANRMRLALAREKQRSELVEKVIAQTRCFTNFGGVHCGLAGVEIAIKDLDTFDKEAAK